jgi:putative peptide zinc metalloprotease protein
MADAPSLADGVELIGEYDGSGFKEPPSLVRRADGQVIQLPPLLYQVVAKADGRRSEAEIADEVGHEIRRGLDAEQVHFLMEEKLRPLGIVANADGSTPSIEKPDPFLALRFRAAVIPERVSNALGAAFGPLFSPVVVAAVAAAFVAGDAWLFFEHGVAQALRVALYHPGLFLPLFAGVVLSAAFHEVGHAAACRYGGGRPGKMGCGLYLAWPAFYTDVTDSYRLDRRARLRTDLGGVYFNVVFVVGTLAAYLATGFEPLLLLAVVQHFEIAHQLLPVVRLDGYYIVADLTGVPDLFARIGPILRSVVPGRAPDERVTVLKRWVRVAVTAWVLVVIPLLLLELIVVLVHLPRIIGTAWDSGAALMARAGDGLGGGQWLAGMTAALQVVVLAIPVLGILLVLAGAGRRGGLWIWTATEGRPGARALAVAATGAGVAALLFAWVPRDNYEPIRPGERGTLPEATGALRRLPAGTAPLPDRWPPPGSPAAGPPEGLPGDGSTTTTSTTPTTTEATTSTTRPSTVATTPAGGPATSSTIGGTAATTSSTTRSTTTTAGQPSTTTTTIPSSTTTTAP